MPSANPKLEKQASTEAVEPIRQAIIVIEHKIRNLEKRKGRLESYRDIVKNGGELNGDQKMAVDKYDEVHQTLESTRELYKQIVGIANDAAKMQKKLARKEALERMQQDISKVREVLIIQDTLMNMGVQAIRDDFINGANGAVKLTEEDFKYLDDFYIEVMLKHDRESPFLQQAQKVAEHYVLILDGKQREVVGTSYSKLKEIITSITQCGYFDQVPEAETPVEEVVQAVSETQISNVHAAEQVNEEYNNSNRHIIPQPQPENLMPIQTFPVPVATIPVVPGTTPVQGAIPVVAQPIPTIAGQGAVETYYTNSATFVPTAPVHQQLPQQPNQPPVPTAVPAPRINDVIGPTTNFFFLQESEIDTTEANAPASQEPPVVTHIPTPIPTQTFTNQSFTGPPVVSQVLYQHQPTQEMAHLPAFGNTNPTIPLSQAHQTTMQLTPQNPASFPQQQSQTFEQMSQQESLISQKEEIHENSEKIGNESGVGEGDIGQNNDSSNWGQMLDEWNQTDTPQESNDSQQIQYSQAWGYQPRGGFRNRGRDRGHSNGYNNRGRGNFQQNGRGTYYQNGYRNWSNNGEGNGGYNNSTFKRSTNNQPRGGPRGERGGMDRGGRGGGQFRGNQRGANRPNYAPRGKAQAQN